MISPKLFIELEKEEENVRKSSTQSLEGIKVTKARLLVLYMLSLQFSTFTDYHLAHQ